MTKDYLSTRQCPVQGAEAELKAKLAALALAFEEAWLEAEGTHPLQVLWRRQDGLACIELLNFGDAVERLHKESPSWLAGQVHAIKTGDAGQSTGAVFEILALNLFSRQFCRVTPAPEGMPGFDGTLVLRDESRVFVSIKNHGQSRPEQDFLKESAAFDAEFKAQLAAQGFNDAEINVLAHAPMNAAAFGTLKTDIGNCLKDLKAGKMGGELDRPFTIQIKGMAPQYPSLSAFGVSSCCRVMAPIAPNEQANFNDAIRKGCENLYKHTKNETGDFCRMIILRLSNTASIAKCHVWADWYFREYPEEPVDIILLYQCAVTTNAGTDTSVLTHYVSVVTGSRFQSWQKKEDGSTRRLPTMSVLVGVISGDQPKLLLTSNGSTGVDISNYYMYQRADVYLRAEPDTVAKLSNPAAGILIHAIFEKDGVQMMPPLSPKFGRDKILGSRLTTSS